MLLTEHTLQTLFRFGVALLKEIWVLGCALVTLLVQILLLEHLFFLFLVPHPQSWLRDLNRYDFVLLDGFVLSWAPASAGQRVLQALDVAEAVEGRDVLAGHDVLRVHLIEFV